MYEQCKDGGDWFTDYEDDDEPVQSQTDNSKYFSDFRRTEWYSSIKPPYSMFFNQEANPENIDDLFTQSRLYEFSGCDSFMEIVLFFNKAKEPTREHQNLEDPNFEMKKPRLQFKQNFFNHIQKLTKYIHRKQMSVQKIENLWKILRLSIVKYPNTTIQKLLFIEPTENDLGDLKIDIPKLFSEHVIPYTIDENEMNSKHNC